MEALLYRWIVVSHPPTKDYLGSICYPFASFFYEIFFDLLHYLSHRALHHPRVYQYLHKVHHTYHNPSLLTTFYHHPIDVLVTNILPSLCTVWVFRIHGTHLALFFVYKTFIEVSGHSGKSLAPRSSFPQLIWLPKCAGVELYAEDHQLHHMDGSHNYGKRFSLWDKIFGTYKNGVCVM